MDRKMGSKNSSASGNRRRSEDGTSTNNTGSSNSFKPDPSLPSEGVEAFAGKPPPPQRPRQQMSTMSNKMSNVSEHNDLVLSEHESKDLRTVREAPAHMERIKSNNSAQTQLKNAHNQLKNAPEEIRKIIYEKDYERDTGYDTAYDTANSCDTFAFDRSERMDRSGHMSRTGSMSVVSDVSYDKPQARYDMTTVSIQQDSGSLLPGLNTSSKSACSMTHGSRRMAEKRAALLRSGSLIFNDWEKKKEEDKDLEFHRWGGRKDYNSSSHHERRRRKKEPKLHKVDQMKVDKQNARDASKKSTSGKGGKKGKRENIKANGGRASGWHNLWGFAFKHDQLQYDQLIREDKDRELVASYCEEPFWKIIFHFKGTVLRVIIEDVLFWLTLATYVAIRIQFHLDPGDETLQANYENLSANLVYVGGFLLFFLVFYVNQNHHRYFQLHQDSMCMMGRVNDIATLVKAILPMERARRINRHMNAAHVAMYTGLSSTYEKDNFFDPLEARFALLTDEELHRVVGEIDVDNSGPKSAFEIITWIMCDIRDAQINSFIDTNEAMQLRTLLLSFRSTIAKVFVTTTLPIPFFYVHFLSMLTAVYLPLFAVVVAFETGEVEDTSSILVAEVVSGLVVFLQSLFVIGLRILGQQLSDPYGGDLIDLQIARYVNMILNGSNQILAAKRLQPPSVETELRLQLKMSSLGGAFEYDTDEECVVQY